jgi:hypothetical protein
MKQMRLGKNVFIRRPLENELGFKDGKVGGARGPAIFISKELTGFFPPLSCNELNDRQPISICAEGDTQSILLNYIYFNGREYYAQSTVKSNGGGDTRNEKRIYISKHHYDFFYPNDFFIFYKVYLESDIYFYVRRIKKGSEEYGRLEEFLKLKEYNSKRTANNALAPLSEIDEILGPVSPPSDVEDDIDESVLKTLSHEDNEPRPIQGKVTRPRPRIDLKEDDDLTLFENSSFRKLVLFFYGKKCAISNNNVIYKNRINLEAAHIKWHAEGGLSHPTNGIPLCRDLHWAFDRGMFTVELDSNNNYQVIVHPSMLQCEYLLEFHNTFMRKPHDSRYLPKIEYLNWHKENIYGNFL